MNRWLEQLWLNKTLSLEHGGIIKSLGESMALVNVDLKSANTHITYFTKGYILAGVCHFILRMI